MKESIKMIISSILTDPKTGPFMLSKMKPLFDRIFN